MKKYTFQKKSTAGEYTKEGENVCPPRKIVYEISFNFTWQNVFDIEACCNKYL